MRFEVAVLTAAGPSYASGADWVELLDAGRLMSGFLGYDPEEQFALTVGKRDLVGRYGDIQAVSVEVRRDAGG